MIYVVYERLPDYIHIYGVYDDELRALQRVQIEHEYQSLRIMEIDNEDLCEMIQKKLSE